MEKVESQETVVNNDDIIYATYERCDAEGNVADGENKIQDTEVLDKLPARLKELVMGKKTDDVFDIPTCCYLQ